MSFGPSFVGWICEEDTHNIQDHETCFCVGFVKCRVKINVLQKDGVLCVCEKDVDAISTQ